MFHRILVPHDDSEGSSRAADVAVALALSRGGVVRLVHHFDAQAFPDAGGYGEPVIQTARAAAERLLQRARTRLQARGIEVQAGLCHVAGETLGRCMAEEAIHWNADLVVLGSHGRKGLARALLGSGAEQIVREAAVPALVVRGKGPAGPGFERILVAIDGSDASLQALTLALQLARDAGGRLRLFHSIGELAFLGGYQYAGPLIEEARSHGEKALDTAEAIARSAGVEAQKSLALGALRLGEAVAQEAAAWNADLVVTGTHGRRGVRRALLGSGAEQILREAPVSVLVVRDRGEEGRA